MHVSQLADRFVKDPHEVVKAGDVVRVRVTEIDVPRKRIGLSMRKSGDAGASSAGARDQKPKPARVAKTGAARPPEGKSERAFGSALAEAMKRASDGS